MPVDMNYDFSGWATRNDILCSDGRTIRRDAFYEQDGATVPLVWNHGHNDASNVIGHCALENRPEGVYCYAYLNNTGRGKDAREFVQHRDVTAFSIYANKLKQVGKDVLHGVIREVSLVLAGANPGATIDYVAQHSDSDNGIEAFIYTDEEFILHGEMEEKPVDEKNTPQAPAENQTAENQSGEKTIGEIFNTMNEEQQNACLAMVAMALEEKPEGEEEAKEQPAETNENETDGGNTVKHNVFDNTEEKNENVISHSDMMAGIEDMKRYGSLKESFIQHGLSGIETLFPEAHAENTVPVYIERDKAWVSTVMNGTKKSKFSRLKSLFADITEDEARARGYLGKTTNATGETNKEMLDANGKNYRDAYGNIVDKSGNRVYKKEEVFGFLKRVTQPTTIYKKQRFDRNDIVDITDFDVIAWIKQEMRTQLDEEIARAILVGDGRLTSSDDKIYEEAIRPIWKDADLYTIKVRIAVPSTADVDTRCAAVIRAAIKSRKDYKGSGSPTLFTTEDWLTDMLLMEDSMGRPLYDSEEALARKMRVSKIVTVPVMENLTISRTSPTSTTETRTLVGLIVNLSDYTVGADKGGEVTMFDDFDIDYNQQKYLIETRCSGSLMKPYSAIALEIIETT